MRLEDLPPHLRAQAEQQLAPAKRKRTTRREAGVDGPYQVRNVLLVRELLDTGDYAPGRTVIEAHRTAPYRAEQFSSAAWTDPGPAGPQVGPDDPSQVGKPPSWPRRKG